MKLNNNNKKFLKAYTEFSEHALQIKKNYIKKLIKENDKTLIKEIESEDIINA